MPDTKKMHYAWWIFIGCCCVGAAGFGAVINVLGVYLIPVTKELGVGVGTWLLWMSFFSVVLFLTLSLWGKWLQTKNFNVVTTIAALLIIIPIFAFSFGTNVYWYWIFGTILGLGFACIATLVVPTLMGNWFDKKIRGRYLGIASAFTGIGTFIWSPVFTMLIQNIGWRNTYLVNGLIIALMLLPFTIFIFKFKPADKGLEPYGYDSNAIVDDNSILKQGVPSSKAFKSAAFWFIIITIFCVSIGSGFNSNMVAMIKELVGGAMDPKSTAMLGASILSAAAIGNIIGKIVFGFIADKASIKTAFALYMILMLVSFVLFFLSRDSKVLLVAGFCFGTHNAIVSVGFPLVTRSVFGNKDYTKIFANLMTVNGLVGGFAATIIAFIYQLLGSYISAIVIAMVLVIVAFISIILACNYIGKLAWVNEDTNAAS